MIKDVKELKNKHVGSDIWVLGSGPSLNHISKDFFENKIVVGTNRVCVYFPCTYSVNKDSRGFGELKRSIGNCTHLISKKPQGNQNRKEDNTIHIDFPCYMFDHPHNNPKGPDVSCIGSDKLVVSSSTITSAIHSAAYMGAKNIILVGHDCGSIDGKVSYDGYYDRLKPSQSNMNAYKNFVSNDIQSHTTAVCKRLKEVYGVNIHSLNPFINLSLPGHTYQQ